MEESLCAFQMVANSKFPSWFKIFTVCCMCVCSTQNVCLQSTTWQTWWTCLKLFNNWLLTSKQESKYYHLKEWMKRANKMYIYTQQGNRLCPKIYYIYLCGTFFKRLLLLSLIVHFCCCCFAPLYRRNIFVIFNQVFRQFNLFHVVLACAIGFYVHKRVVLPFRWVYLANS